jgi:transcriptional regulatory protein RtcR
VPYKVTTILADPGIQFAEQPRNRNTIYPRPIHFNMICLANGIELPLQRRFDVARREHAALLLGGVATRSPAMQQMIERLDLVAGTTDAPIFRLGEAGTGKSALAARLHELKLVRRRMKGLLVQVNCATLRDGALPALLGQRRAAMGAAGSERPGYLREADSGVLFLDQIDELPPEAQAALLQSLETGRYSPVGSEAEVSVRLQLIRRHSGPAICVTCRPLLAGWRCLPNAAG